MLKPYSFGLMGADLIYRDALHHLFADHTKRSYVSDLYQIDLPKADQPAPMVNMVGAGPICQDAVHHLFADHAERSHVNDLYQIDFPEVDQPAPMVNMVQI